MGRHGPRGACGCCACTPSCLDDYYVETTKPANQLLVSVTSFAPLPCNIAFLEPSAASAPLGTGEHWLRFDHLDDLLGDYVINCDPDGVSLWPGNSGIITASTMRASVIRDLDDGCTGTGSITAIATDITPTIVYFFNYDYLIRKFSLEFVVSAEYLGVTFADTVTIRQDSDEMFCDGGGLSVEVEYCVPVNSVDPNSPCCDLQPAPQSVGGTYELLVP